jgi:hypothetical protein
VVASCLQKYVTAKELVKAICKEEDNYTAGRFAMLTWVLFCGVSNRNNLVWNGSKESGRSLGIKSCHLWEEWNSVQQQHSLMWQKPPMGWKKCNVDAGFHQGMNKTSAGWCLRDHTANFIVAGTSWKEGNCSIVEGEVHALFEALRQVENQGITHVIFETDSKSVVDAMQSTIQVAVSRNIVRLSVILRMYLIVIQILW